MPWPLTSGANLRARLYLRLQVSLQHRRFVPRSTETMMGGSHGLHAVTRESLKLSERRTQRDVRLLSANGYMWLHQDRWQRADGWDAPAERDEREPGHVRWTQPGR